MHEGDLKRLGIEIPGLAAASSVMQPQGVRNDCLALLPLPRSSDHPGNSLSSVMVGAKPAVDDEGQGVTDVLGTAVALGTLRGS